MERGTLITFLLFALPFTIALVMAVRLLQRGGRLARAGRGEANAAPDRKRLAHLLHDDIGQKFAAARVNLSALRSQLRMGGIPETAELDAAMNLLDDGCRDLRTVSRLMASADDGTASVGDTDGGKQTDERS